MGLVEVQIRLEPEEGHPFQKEAAVDLQVLSVVREELQAGLAEQVEVLTVVPEVQKAEREDLMVVQEVIQLADQEEEEGLEAPEDLPSVELVGHWAVQAAYP